MDWAEWGTRELAVRWVRRHREAGLAHQTLEAEHRERCYAEAREITAEMESRVGVERSTELKVEALAPYGWSVD